MVKFNGTLKNLRPDIAGEGTLQWQNGERYEGQMINMKAEGFGHFKYENGWYYYGDLYHNKRHGIGIFEKPDFEAYSGHFQNNLMHGYGNFTSPVGITYQCEWEKGNRSGLCTTYYVNGDIEIGLWKNDLREGKHYLSLKDPDTKYVIRSYEGGEQLGSDMPIIE
ncbi:hypothetical protein FGO68_gene826 [Halteria grandinella]|uniref:MORN repeat-containing protein n=1 Tax=Halteria grandinella TaxID=5974 RepID=A0A8J8NVS8_HALGN|nr:hypothetical protein FGO68_gene826 [Halteria grandinella]